MKKIITLSIFALLSNVLFSQAGGQAFTTSGSFTVPSGVTSITIEVVGGGGAGGGNGAGGGGGGGYASGVYTVIPLSVLPVTIGDNGNGSVAGTTSVGSLISATGGSNGTSIANPNIGGGGTGGIGMNGTLTNNAGGNGGGGYYTYFGGGGGGAAGPAGSGSNGGNTIVWTGNNCLTPGGTGGATGGAPGGAGGKGAGFTDNNCNVTNPSGNGLTYGGGGGGANGNGGGAGTGSPGYAYISWGTTGVINTLLTENISVFPNPFTGKINLRNNKGDENFELFNAIGKVIWSGKHIEQRDFSELPIGLYFLKIQALNSNQTIRLIKQ